MDVKLCAQLITFVSLAASILVFKKGSLLIRSMVFILALSTLVNILMEYSVRIERIDLAYLLRYFYGGIETCFIIWFCIKAMRSGWQKVFGWVLIAIAGSVWLIYIGLDQLKIMDFPLALVESYTNIVLAIFVGYTMLKRLEGEMGSIYSPENIILFGIFFYVLVTIVIFRLMETALGEQMYFIHHLALLVAHIVYITSFTLEYRRQTKLMRSMS